MAVCLLVLSLVLDSPGEGAARASGDRAADAAQVQCERDLRQVRRKAAQLGRGLLRRRGPSPWTTTKSDAETRAHLEPLVRATLRDPEAQKALRWDCRGAHCRATLSAEVGEGGRARLDDLTASELRAALGPRVQSAVENLRPLYPEEGAGDEPRRVAKTVHLVLAKSDAVPAAAEGDAAGDCEAKLAARRARLSELEDLAKTTPRAAALFAAGSDNPPLAQKVAAEIARILPAGPRLPVWCRDRLCRVEAPSDANAHGGLALRRRVRLDAFFRDRPMAFEGPSLFISMENPPTAPPERSPISR